MKPSHPKRQVHRSIEFLQQYSYVAADAQLEIGTTVISAAWSLVKQPICHG
jgi:hypothetical protein